MLRLGLMMGWCVLVVVGTGADRSRQTPTIAATVDQREIMLAEVDKLVDDQTHHLTLNATARQVAQAEAVKQLVGEVLVTEYLTEHTQAISDDELKLELERLEQKLKSVGKTLDGYCAEQRLTPAGLERQIRFRESWRRYLESMLTEDNLKKHFEKNRRDLDGTQLRVQHLLLKFHDPDQTKAEPLIQQAESIRQEILSGKTTWDQAVHDHSDGPSAENNGDLGSIQRHSPMPESFSQAAFKLNPGEISPPVTTRFGVHLIRCVSIEPGDETWETIRPKTIRHATQFLFDWICQQQLPKATVQYTKDCPHWDADGRLVAE